MRDPLDDLLNTPDATVSPFDPLEVDLPHDVAEATARAAHAYCARQLEEALGRTPPDPVSVDMRRRRLQQAIEALAWIQQQGEQVRMGLYPIDYKAELAYFDELLDKHPDFQVEDDDDLPLLPPGTSLKEDVEEAVRRAQELQRKLDAEARRRAEERGDGDAAP